MVEFVTCANCDTPMSCKSQQKCYMANAVTTLGSVLQEFGEHADSPLQDTASGAHALLGQVLESKPSDAQSNAALLASVAETVHVGSEEIEPSQDQIIAELRAECAELAQSNAILMREFQEAIESRDTFSTALDKSRDAYNELLCASSVESAAEREITRIVELYRKSEISGTLKLSVEAQCSSGARDCELEFCCSVEWNKEVKANTLDAAYETAARRYWQDKAIAPKRIAFAG